MGSPDDEQDWIRQSQRGDHEAFAALLTRYQRMIYSLTFRMSGSFADADDLTQETFIQAFRHLERFRCESRFSSWLCQIAINTCLNWRQTTARRERRHQNWVEHKLTLEADRQMAETVEDDTSRRVQKALLELHPKQRAAIVLTVYQEMSHADAARVLGCSETTVSWRLFAARAKLRRLLKVRSAP